MVVGVLLLFLRLRREVQVFLLSIELIRASAHSGAPFIVTYGQLPTVGDSQVLKRSFAAEVVVMGLGLGIQVVEVQVLID